MLTSSPFAPQRISFQPKSAVRCALLLWMTGLLHACAWYTPFRQPLDLPDSGAQMIERSRFVLRDDDSVIGQLATVHIRNGDTLPDVARHYGLGHEQIAAANPGLDVWIPEADSRVLLPLQFTLPEAPRKGIVVNLAAMRLFSFPGKGGREVVTYPVGIGREGRSTPTGDMSVARKTLRPTWYVPESIRRDHAQKGNPLPAMVSPGPDNPLGEYAMYLTRASYLIHGTNKPYAIGLRASNGCLRLYPENIEPLYHSTPVRTPVRIVNQPYLLGWRNEQLYLEAHDPHEELYGKALRKQLFTKLKGLEKKQGLRLDWKKIETVLIEARGIPVPILENTGTMADLMKHAVTLHTPAELYGRPKTPPGDANSWYVRALETKVESTAKRAAAMLNHLGPQIPAHVVPAAGGRYQVMAGPFKDAKSSKAAAQRMMVDLEMRGKIVPPNELTLR